MKKEPSISQNPNVEVESSSENTRCDDRECKCVTNVCCCCEHERPQPKEEVGYCHHRYIETCTFDIYMTRVRVFDNKDGKAELMITGYANGQSGVFPGMGCWFVISEKWGWVNINKRITSITIEKGTHRAVEISADAIEEDGLLGGRWELGSGPVRFLSLQCGQQSGVEHVQVDIHRPTVQADVRCRIEVEFTAFQVTP